MEENKNTCDICGCIENTQDLIWFSEDFQPKHKEVVDWDMVKEKDLQAVCEDCYVTKLLLSS